MPLSAQESRLYGALGDADNEAEQCKGSEFEITLQRENFDRVYSNSSSEDVTQVVALLRAQALYYHDNRNQQLAQQATRRLELLTSMPPPPQQTAAHTGAATPKPALNAPVRPAPKKPKPTPAAYPKVSRAQFARLREIKGVDRKTAASDLEVNKVAVKNWETGKYSPTTKHLRLMKDYYGISVENLRKPARVADVIQLSTEQRRLLALLKAVGEKTTKAAKRAALIRTIRSSRDADIAKVTAFLEVERKKGDPEADAMFELLRKICYSSDLIGNPPIGTDFGSPLSRG